MEYEQAQLSALSQKVAQTLGDKIRALSPVQEASLENQLVRTLEFRKGDASKVTPQEIQGAYEMVTEQIFPADFNALSEQYQAYLREGSEASAS
jgi:hypothetical protein